ncbi:E3 ubiquitin-protein ligase RNF8 [Drosophila erecta]|uniref:RING-type domain-containing protein n=1 Tax=Drosophila erecta TaxID=7220 RepID=B3NG04_DROER|nr:E3 ubiquitin-protein ligase RNF8 [Drosophila erecta]EDV50833.1 uncharacterized protein Dere_GG14234 [Drosophila erecta]
MLHLHKIQELFDQLHEQQQDLQELLLEECPASPEQRLVQLESSTSRMHQYHRKREDMLLSLEEEISKYESATPLVDRIAQMHSQVSAVNEALDKMYEINVCSICDLKCGPHGRHSLVSLRCGHLFGCNCINNALRESSRCPTCSRAALQHHVRRIYGLHFYPF